MSEKHTAPPAAAPAEPSEVKLGMLSLWMIGVGSFIGGNFIGWPSVLIGGFGSALISVGYFGVYFLLLGNATGERFSTRDRCRFTDMTFVLIRRAIRSISGFWRYIYV